MRDVGENTGNLLFRHAIRTQLADELSACTFEDAVKLASEQHFDAVVVAAANWLVSSVPFGNRHRAECLKKIGLPVICIGLGCQHPSTTYEKLSFTEEARELLKVLLDLDAYVLVRDAMTLEQCRHYGLKNLFLIGCPSNFINHDPAFPEKLMKSATQESFTDVTLNIGFNIAEVQQHDVKLLPLVMAGQGLCVLQSNFDHVISVAMGRRDEFDNKDVRKLKSAYGMKASFIPWRSNFPEFKKRMRAYFDVPCWLDDAACWDIAFGSRIHGAMAALQACTPAVLTTIDSRTQGLAEQMQIPHVRLEDSAHWESGVSVAKIMAEAAPCFSTYLDRRSALAKSYADILQSFGLTLSEGFQAMIDSLTARTV